MTCDDDAAKVDVHVKTLVKGRMKHPEASVIEESINLTSIAEAIQNHPRFRTLIQQ
jgi:hypothetical protein